MGSQSGYYAQICQHFQFLGDKIVFIIKICSLKMFLCRNFQFLSKKIVKLLVLTPKFVQNLVFLSKIFSF